MRYFENEEFKQLDKKRQKVIERIMKLDIDFIKNEYPKDRWLKELLYMYMYEPMSNEELKARIKEDEGMC